MGRPGKPSLVLDLVEEFRQPVVDRAVIASINLGQNFEMEGGLLDAESRKTIATKILDRLETRESFKDEEGTERQAVWRSTFGSSDVIEPFPDAIFALGPYIGVPVHF